MQSPCQTLNLGDETLLECGSNMEGYIEVSDIAVLDNFSCGISVIPVSKCGIAVFFESAGCGF